MASEGLRKALVEVEDTAGKGAETEASISASPPLHEPRFRCRLAHLHRIEEKSNTFRFAFLAEGAANAVFRTVPCSPYYPDNEISFVFENLKGEIMKRDELSRKVLRISKGKPKTLKYKEIMEGFENEVVPLFRMSEPPQDENLGPKNALGVFIKESFEEFIMDHEGVAISPEALEALIAELHMHCPGNRHIEPHHLEERAILLPDMSSTPGSAITVEIKPKWLVQSPNAPRDAYLCRTCALHASRKSKKPYKGAWICPLSLAAGDTAAIKPYFLDRLLQAVKEEAGKDAQKQPVNSVVLDTILKRAVPYLATGSGHRILQHIRYLQSQLDQKGVLRLGLNSSIEDDHCLRLAMTLRDCSLFIRIPWADENAPIEAKLGDLDFKSHGKKDDWAEKEQALINGGWYVDMQSGIEQCWIAQGWKLHTPHYF